MPRYAGIVLAILTLVLSPSWLCAADRPNVVLIMTDNHGAWTLGCYGNQEIRTPNIDRLAREGTLFEEAFSSNPVCSPTRATFLTGLMPSQHGVHCFLFGGRLQVGPEARCTLDRFTSLPEILKRRGYDCGLVGKWHLGDNLNPQEGFDDYWITTPHGGTSTFYDAPIIENGKIRNEPTYLTEFWTNHAVKYIKSKAKSEKPFFLFLSYNGPYALGRLLLREGKNRHAAYYRDKTLNSFSDEPIHPWQYNNRDYQHNQVSLRRVATEVSGVDDGVGRVMTTLRETGLDDNTLVVFVADQGWSGGHGGFFGMGDHTRPLTARDAMMRIPMIWRQPGVIAPNRRSKRMVTNYDFLPTMLAQLDLDADAPEKPRSPGVDFSVDLDPTVESSPSERSVFYEFEGLRCIRTSRWKYVHRHPNGPHALFDLQTDPDELDNLVARPEHAERKAQLKSELDAFYDKYAEREFDMWRGGGSQTRIFVGVEPPLEKPKSVEPPAPPESFRPQPITVPNGFTVELAAAPPLVTHPTLACLDDRGRLFVCNNAGVNMSAAELEKNVPNSIRMLEDRDGDGRYDRSTVFADKMTFPMGGAWHDGALYVASPPNIWRLEDTNDDGVADKREIIVSQFGYTGNAASIHGCFFGPDGRLYWCDGYHGHEFRDDAGEVVSKREGSYLFSCWPDGSDVRIHCGGGMDNPVEVDFTDAGDVIGTVNILYTRPRVDCQVHWLYGGAYPHRERVLNELKTTGPLLEPMHRFGHVAVSGTTRYRSGVLDHRWTDNFFTTFFNSGRVVRLELSPKGSTYEVTQREFLSSASSDFHPTDMLEDADGSLLVIDTGGWFYRGCPTSQLSKPEVMGAIYRIRRHGMTTLPDPRGEQMKWDAMTPNQLMTALNDTRHVVRERAIAEAAKRGAAKRGAEMTTALRVTLVRRDIRARLGAVHALTRIARESVEGHERARGPLRVALKDREPVVQQAACHAIAQNPDPAAFDELVTLLGSTKPAVRRAAATALGRLGDPRGAGPLLEVAHRAVDRSEEHAIAYALIEINSVAPVVTALLSPSPVTKRIALAALDQMDEADVGADIVATLLDDDDAKLRAIAWGVFKRRATARGAAGTWTAAASTRIEAMIHDAELAAQRREIFGGLVAMFADNRYIASVVGRALGSGETTEETRELLLDALASTRGLTLPTQLATPLKLMLRSGDEAQIDRALHAITAFRAHRLHPDLQKIGADKTLSPMVRVAALRAASGNAGKLSDEAFALLREVLISGSPANRGRAAQTISSVSLSAKQLESLAPALVSAGPLTLRELMRPFQRNQSEKVGAAFLAAMERAKSLASVPTPEYTDVIKRYPAALRGRANALLERVRHSEGLRTTLVDRLLGRIGDASAERGKRVFHGKKSKCATCHRVGEDGGKIGPDLTTIGANRGAADLLESIVFPSASIVRQYEPYTVALTDGRVLSGLIIADTGKTMTLQPQTGDPIKLSRDEIEELTQSPVSLMPQNVAGELSDEEIADLVAYMLLLKAR